MTKEKPPPISPSLQGTDAVLRRAAKQLKRLDADFNTPGGNAREAINMLVVQLRVAEERGAAKGEIEKIRERISQLSTPSMDNSVIEAEPSKLARKPQPS